MKTVGSVLALLIAVGPIATLAQAADRGDKIAVMALRKDVDLPDGTLRTLNEVLLNEFHQQGKLEVLGASDIESMLSLEATRQKFSACEDDSCLAEIGGALGVQLMAASSLGAVGKVLAAVVGPVLKDKKPNQAVASEAPDTGRGAWGWAPWVTLGLAVAAAGAGGALGGLALADAKDARAAVPDSDEWHSARNDAEGTALGADLLFGVAGAAAVTTLVLFLLRPDADEPQTEVRVEPTAALVPGGAVALRAH